MKSSKNREEYLAEAIELLKPLFKRVDANVPEVRVSTGWPVSKGVAAKRRSIGECWPPDCAADKVTQIFISPFLSDPLHISPGDAQGVLPTLAHELIHASVGCKAKHGAPFRKVARGIGLEGKLTATHAGEALLAELKVISEKLGEYPHGKLDKLPTEKKQSTRMVKCECSQCGYTARTTRKWLEIGAPLCPAGHGPLSFEPAEGDSDSEESDE